MQDSYRNAGKHPLNINFVWGTRTTAPNFSYAGSGEIDHIVNDMDSYILYNNIRFNLASVQLTSPTHNSWIVPATLEVTKLNNREDIIATYQLDTFSSNGDKDPKYIILVNPILRKDSPMGSPTYLSNLANGVASSVSLEELFPYDSNKDYAYYTTCIPGDTLNDNYKNILVILNTEGLLVSTDIMSRIKENYNKSTPGDYALYIPLANFSVSPSKSMVSGLEAFTNASVTTGKNTPGNNTPGNSNPATDTTYTGVKSYNSMKCVPFDPERNLTKNGDIVIDTATGTPYTLNSEMNTGEQLNILKLLTKPDGSRMFPDDQLAVLTNPEEINSLYQSILPDTSRQTIKKQFTIEHTGTIQFTTIEQVFAAICGIACLVIVVLLFISFMGILSNKASPISDKILDFLKYIVLGAGMFIGGFITGFYTLPAKCP
jgi:hypothetical protein